MKKTSKVVRVDLLNFIVKDGKSDYAIVYPVRAKACRFAANELQKYVQQATGVTLPVISDEKLMFDVNAQYISLGKTSLLEQANLRFDYSTLKPDGFFVNRVGSVLFIDGNTEKSVVYGAYDFLEQQVGVRFVATNSDYVPKVNEVKLPSWNKISNPAFNGRSYYDMSTNHDKELCVKMRMSHGMMDIPEEMGGNFGWADTIISNHNSIIYVDPKKYPLEKYPQFYSTRRGEIRDICWTYGITDDGKLDENILESPIRVAIESLKGYVKNSKPSSRYFMFAQMDGGEEGTACQCERCRAMTKKYMRSGVAIRFVNILAEEIQKWADAELNGRKVDVVTFAYAYTNDAPVKFVNGKYELLDPTVKPRDNVIIRLARIGASYYYPYNDLRQEKETTDFFEQWVTVHNRFFIWSYHSDWRNTFDLASNIHMWNQQLHYLQDIGVEDIFMLGEYRGIPMYKTSLETYIASRMLWNIDIDIEAKVLEFHRLYFGEAAYPYVNEYVDRHTACIHTGYANGTLKFGGTIFTKEATAAENFPLEFVLEQEERIQKAIQATREDSTLTEEEKEKYVKRVMELGFYSKYLLVENYEQYYGTTDGQLEVAKIFQEDCKYVDKVYSGETTKMVDYFAKFGL